MAPPADEEKWISICSKVTTTIGTATSDERKKLRIATPKVHAGAYVWQRKNGRFQAQIYIFSKLRTIGTFLNEEEATLAYAIVMMQLGVVQKGKRKKRQKEEGKRKKRQEEGKRKKYQKTTEQQLKESVVRVNSICVSCQCLSLYFCYSNFYLLNLLPF